MLGIRRLTTRGIDYYFADLARELPVPAQSRAVWLGCAAAGLGLEGSVDPAQLGAVLQGGHPTTGRPLRAARATGPGFDLTFSAPKSVSVLFALGGQEVAQQVVAAQHQGVHGAVAYLERHGLAARRGSGEDRMVVPTTGLVAGAFTHGVNRNLDPHLHTHVVMANLVHGVDGQWGACDQRGLSAHREAAGAMYDAQLRAGLTLRLGVGWVAGPDRRVEVGGISPLVRAEFSSRSADIRRHMAEWGAHSAGGAHVAWAATRSAKGSPVSFASLAEQWEARARSMGPEECAVGAAIGHHREGVGERNLDEHRYHSVLAQTPDGAARRRDVVTALATASVGGAPALSVEQLADLWVPTGPDRPEVGVAEHTLPLRDVVPGRHLFRALGPRPIDPAAHAVWRAAARSIDDYRRHWAVTSPADALGLDPADSRLASLPTDRLVEHLRTARQVESACRQLGWRASLERGLDRGR